MQTQKRGKINDKVQADHDSKYTMKPALAPKSNKIASKSKDKEFRRGQNLSQQRHSQILAQKSSKKEAMRNAIKENQKTAEVSECTFDPQLRPDSVMKVIGVTNMNHPRL